MTLVEEQANGSWTWRIYAEWKTTSHYPCDTDGTDMTMELGKVQLVVTDEREL